MFRSNGVRAPVLAGQAGDHKVRPASLLVVARLVVSFACSCLAQLCLGWTGPRAAQRGLLSPIHLDHIRDAGFGHPRLRPERHEPNGWRGLRARGKRNHGIEVEVVVVVVRDHNRVDRWQLIRRHRRWPHARRPGELHGRAAMREDGVGEHVPTVPLRQNRGVPQPRHLHDRALRRRRKRGGARLADGQRLLELLWRQRRDRLDGPAPLAEAAEAVVDEAGKVLRRVLVPAL
eukprot:scaffold54161_cov58-Phaeocystis_antarctica.AAC.1